MSYLMLLLFPFISIETFRETKMSFMLSQIAFIQNAAKYNLHLSFTVQVTRAIA